MVKEGYKETEIGVIPEDWRFSHAKELMNIKTGSKNTEHKSNNGRYPLFVRSQQVEHIDNYSYDCEAVLTAGDGVGTGKVFHYINGKFDAHQRVYVMSQFKGIYGKFFYYYFKENFGYEVLKYTAKSSVDSVRKDMIAEMLIPIPSMEEQQKIAEALSDMDNLISALEKLIEKKKAIKQACLQKMFPKEGELVSEMRLPGFTDAWEQRKLGDIGVTYTGLSGKTKDDFGHGLARFVTYMNVFSNPISNPEMTEPIEIDPKQNEVEVGDVFFTTSSETPEEVGMSSVLLEKRGKTYLNSFCFGFRPLEKIDSYYLAYMLRSESAREKIILLAQGISRYNISKNKVMEIVVSLPSLDEQKLIGQYFRQLDDLIALHQRKLEKCKKIKEGMMQQLLTGKIRLI